ncbi:hypothetical protein [Abyssicoccus albus]|nr:hypothetical protein [Abyssicoccus albus]
MNHIKIKGIEVYNGINKVYKKIWLMMTQYCGCNGITKGTIVNGINN